MQLLECYIASESSTQLNRISEMGGLAALIRCEA
jgi:hypothetical protein